MPGGQVLMLAHHFPPAGGSGSNRALAFARYLPAFGWRPIVVTPGTTWAANYDAVLGDEVPHDLHIVRTRSLEPRAVRGDTAKAGIRGRNERNPGRLKRHLGHLRRFPDAHVGWLPFAFAAAKQQPYDVAYSSSGPFTSHVVGLLLKRLTGKPWVAELRDGWYRWNRAIFPDYPAWRDALESRLESAVIRSADRVVLVTERMAQAFRTQYAASPADHFAVIPNGFDPVQFGKSKAHHRNGGEFTALHAGALYYGRSLTTFLEAVRRLTEMDASFGREFRLRLLGTLDGAAQAEVARSGLGDCINVVGQTNHASAIAAMCEADALLLVANTTPGAEATVPGKLFEYLAVGTPILAIAPRESATADVLLKTGGGWLAEASDVDAIACALRRAYAERSAPTDRSGLAAYDRRSLTRELAAIFEQVLQGA